MTLFLRLFVKFFLFSGLLGLAIASAGVTYLEPQLPKAAELRDIDLQIPLRIYTRDKKLIGEFGEKRRIPIKYEDIPPLFIKAMLAAEDDAFFEHRGIDIKGLTRAALELIATGSIQSGGSTITMQVAKNYFLSFDQTFTRKFTEILLALRIEQELSKQAILSLYLNKIYLGKRAYGIQAAAQIYYGKPIDQLNLAQQAMIAGLPKAPSAYNPIANPSRAVSRRNWILGRMLKLQHIDQPQYEIALNQPVSAEYHGATVEVNAPYIAEMIRREMLQRYGKAAYSTGFNVYATIDSSLQTKAQSALRKGLQSYDDRHGYRGPEDRLIFEPNADLISVALSHLKTASVIDGLAPAVILSMKQQSAEALLSNGSLVTLNWDSLKTLRRHINENRRAASPKESADVLSIGDIVRLKQNEKEQWLIQQTPNIQGTLIALDSNSGAVLSLVGGYNFNLSKFNRATQAKRQPGSNFKPFFYAYAMENGFTPASLINDAAIVFDDQGSENEWRPDNSSGKFYGPTPIRRALYLSRNLVSIRLLQALGVNNVVSYVERFGFNPKTLPRNLSLALGTQTITPLKIVTAYASLSNGGFRVKPYWIETIADTSNTLLFEASPLLACPDCQKDQNPDEELMATGFDELDLDAEPSQAERIVDARTVYIIDSILQDVVKRGTAIRAKVLNRNDLAGKTGTTNGPTDAWFSGYNADIAATVWVGFDEYQKLGQGEYGGSAALPIWIDFMATALKNSPDTPRKRPLGITSVLIDPKTGLRVSAGTEGASFEIFREDNVPALLREQRQNTSYEETNTAIDEGELF